MTPGAGCPAAARHHRSLQPAVDVRILAVADATLSIGCVPLALTSVRGWRPGFPGARALVGLLNATAGWLDAEDVYPASVLDGQLSSWPRTVSSKARTRSSASR